MKIRRLARYLANSVLDKIIDAFGQTAGQWFEVGEVIINPKPLGINA